MQFCRAIPSRGSSCLDTCISTLDSRSRVLFVLLLAALTVGSAMPLKAEVVISEFLASNIRNLADEDGSYEDWIELYNDGSTPVNLDGWFLTDSAKDLRKWRLPATNINATSTLIVFASNKDRRSPGRTLHTNFKLSPDGEYLALVKPDGVTTTTAFSPTFPPQAPDVSYGFGVITTNITLIAANASRRVLVPSVANGGSALLEQWRGGAEPFADNDWVPANGGVGYSGADALLIGADTLIARYNFDAAPVGKTVLDTKPQGITRPATNNNALWLASASDGGSVSITRSGVMQFTATTNTQITIPTNSDLNIARGSVAFWMRSSGTSGAGGVGAVLAERRTSAGGFALYQLDDGTLRFTANGAATKVQNLFGTTGAVGDNRWHHVALNFDLASNAVVSIYIDGLLSGSNRNTNSWAWPTSSVFSIGRALDANSSFRKFNGHLDDVRLYNRLLTGDDVAQIHQGDGGIDASDMVIDLSAQLRNQNTSAFVRIPFMVDNPDLIQALSLRVKYDDGYVAWLNGKRIGSANAPETLSWTSAATADHSVGLTDTLLVSAAPGTLKQGSNILAIQALNRTANDPTFFITAELVGLGTVKESATALYFVPPSPGQPNGVGSKVPGPSILEVRHTPEVPVDQEDLLVTARLSQSFAPIRSALLRYRVMFSPEVTVPMLDDGQHGDGLAGDGLYGATIPASASTPGQMVRYAISVTDDSGNQSRWPLFNSPLESPEYLGTVVSPDAVSSKLPVFHLFVSPQHIAGIDSETGGRLAVFHDGEFYDNVYMELRGNTSAGLPKKSHRLEFHRDHPLRHPGPGTYVRKTSFIAEHLDPAYVRQGLSFWLLNATGVPAPFYYPARLQMNGEFYQLASHTDVMGEDQLERMGYDPNGALYKAAGTITSDGSSTGGFEKKTRTWENNNDYIAMATGISEAKSTATRRTNAFDTLDIPNVVNYLACARWVQEGDDVWANMTVYRDSDGDKLWRIIPFDMNLSWGALYYGDNSTLNAGVTSTDDSNKSHPLYGGQAIIAASGGNWNRMYDVIITVPETRQMLLRRMRTIMDKFIQPPSTHPMLRKFEARIYALTNSMWNEAFIDRAKWGWPELAGPYGLGPNQWLTNATQELVEKFIEPRRTHWYVTHSATNLARPVPTQPAADKNAGIPDAQPDDVTLTFGALDANPSSGNQSGEYLTLINPNNYAVDISDWKLSGAVDFTFHGGTVIPSNSTVYVVRDFNGFRARATAPRGGQGLYMVGPYKGQLSARGETLVLTDDRGRGVATNSYAGAGTPAQQALRITELMYHPALPPAGSPYRASDFEYIELRNISADTLNLDGIHFTNGLAFQFSGSAVTSLAAGERVLVVHNLAAFTSRYGSQLKVAGEYAGTLDNSGEQVVIHDALGEVVLDFQFQRDWFPVTDGPGFSLVIKEDTLPYSAWSLASSWRISSSASGSPGTGDGVPAIVAPVLINELIAYPVSGKKEQVELYNPNSQPVNLSGWYLTDDFLTPRKYRFPNGSLIAAKGYLVLSSDDFEATPGAPGSFAFDNSGDQVYLFSGDANGELTGYQHGFAFGATLKGSSLGRHVNSQGLEQWVMQQSPTLGSENNGPLVGPVVLSEFHYHPAPQAPGSPAVPREFVELRNIGQSTAFLFDAGTLTNTWHLRGEVDFNFPTNVSLLPGEAIVVVGFDPIADAAARQIFSQDLGLPANARLFGPFAGNFSNKSGELRLSQPVVGADGVVDHATVDAVHYSEALPWPVSADGFGASLHRRTPAAYGDDPLAWSEGIPTPAATQATGSLPAIVTQPSNNVLLAGITAQVPALATSSGPLAFQWLKDGQALDGARSATLTIASLRPEDAGQYQLVIVGAAGTVLSAPATLDVLLPAFFTTQPRSRQVLAGTNVVFTAQAVGAGPVSYQWRKNSQVIPGATGSSLSLTNVKPGDSGLYDVLATDSLGTLASLQASLIVSIKPTFLFPPQPITVLQGETVIVFTTVAGTTPLTYRWTVNGRAYTNITSFENTGVLRIPNVQPSQSGPITLTVTNLGGASTTSPRAQLTVLADADRDGMADLWETANGFSSADPLDGDLDTDKDGMSNRAESVAGTSPRDAASVLSMTVTPKDPGVLLSFVAISNHSYSLFQLENVAGAEWQKFADIAAQSNNRVVQILETNLSPETRFFRVIVPAKP